MEQHKQAGVKLEATIFVVELQNNFLWLKNTSIFDSKTLLFL